MISQNKRYVRSGRDWACWVARTGDREAVAVLPWHCVVKLAKEDIGEYEM
jgi:hypothetical protein